eukprot:Pgem_evm1s12165
MSISTVLSLSCAALAMAKPQIAKPEKSPELTISSHAEKESKSFHTLVEPEYSVNKIDGIVKIKFNNTGVEQDYHLTVCEADDDDDDSSKLYRKAQVKKLGVGRKEGTLEYDHHLMEVEYFKDEKCQQKAEKTEEFKFKSYDMKENYDFGGSNQSEDHYRGSLFSSTNSYKYLPHYSPNPATKLIYDDSFDKTTKGNITFNLYSEVQCQDKGKDERACTNLTCEGNTKVSKTRPTNLCMPGSSSETTDGYPQFRKFVVNNANAGLVLYYSSSDCSPESLQTRYNIEFDYNVCTHTRLSTEWSGYQAVYTKESN